MAVVQQCVMDRAHDAIRSSFGGLDPRFEAAEGPLPTRGWLLAHDALSLGRAGLCGAHRLQNRCHERVGMLSTGTDGVRERVHVLRSCIGAGAVSSLL